MTHLRFNQRWGKIGTYVATPNVLNREFTVSAPNQWWVSDITYIHTHEGFLFFAVVMDLFARNIVGWEDLVLSAIRKRKPESTVHFHSDQGSQYSSRKFKKLLELLDIKQSMSRRGNCHDIFNYIEMFYNSKRKHGSNNLLSPVEYENRYQERLRSV